MLDPNAARVLARWFGPLDAPGYPASNDKLYWGKDPEVDAELKRTFGELLERALGGELDAWAGSAQGRLALIILIDQMSRNIHRGSGAMYDGDAAAVALTLAGIALGHDTELATTERVFFYMPLMHAEDRALQRHGVFMFEKLADEAEPERQAGVRNNVDFAIAHRDIVERFGRFPHRNELLGRPSTDEELAFLETPGSSF